MGLAFYLAVKEEPRQSCRIITAVCNEQALVKTLLRFDEDRTSCPIGNPLVSSVLYLNGLTHKVNIRTR